ASRALYSPRISTNHFIFQDEEKTIPQLNQLIQKNKLFAYFVIGPDPVKSNSGSRYVSNNLTDRDLLNWFGGFVTRQVRVMRLQRENLDPDIATWINEPLIFEGLKLSDDGMEEPVDAQDVARQWAPVVFVYLLWISILINTQMLLTNTIEEKSNKLIEVLLSSISPIELMAGKILGIAGTGLTIIVAWTLIAFSFFILLPAAVGINLPVDVSSVISDPWFMSSFLVYFILGYLLYAAILVGLGSLCNNLKDAQNLMLPVQLVQMIPIFVMVPIGRDPNGTLAQILSYFPPLTPFVMMNRAAAPPTTTEYIVTTILLVVSIAVALWFAAKLFRIGVLLTGKPPAMKEIIRWLRAPVANT
ncbi:MAG: ABC transporter permease, partial [Gammaproteobacteria bacterium]|nr:ABC transporter permease [Gammaproteobacteria bacterium]